LKQAITLNCVVPCELNFEKMSKLNEIKSAKAAGQIQFAINLLNQRLVKFIHSKVPDNEKSDFNKSLRIIHQNAKLFFPNPQGQSGLKNKLERARKIRNQYSHQDFDLNRFEHDVECLAKIAALVGAKDVEDKILELIPTLEDSVWQQLKEEGNEHYKNNRWTEAMNSYTKAIRINPNVAMLYSNRSLCEIQLSKFQLAREDAEDALELDPDQLKYYRLLSEAVLNLELYIEASATCEAGLEIDPRDETLLLRLRDCQAMMIDQEIKKNPMAGGIDEHMPESVIQKLQSQCLKSGFDVLPEEIQPFKKSHLHPKIEIDNAHKIMMTSTGNVNKEQEALKIFELAAQRGSAEGLYNLGLMYFNGKAGIARDLFKAREHFLKAADQKPFIKFKELILPNVGVADAENYIAMSYRDGMGVDQNDTLGFQWFLRSAQHGCPSAQNNLGNALYSGIGCTKNMTSARMWFKKAAELGQAEGQFNLAQMLIQGEGGPADAFKAAELLKAAADQGLPKALTAPQQLLRSGATGARSMTDSSKMVQERVKKDDKEAVFLLGVNYMQGSGGFTKNLDKAEKYLRKAFALDHSEADYILGFLLLEQAKNDEAFQFICRAAEIRGDPEAQLQLGVLYSCGHGCDRNEKLARRWLLRASRQGLKSKIDVNTTIKNGQKLVEFEAEQNLSSCGMKQQDRWDRFMQSKGDQKFRVESKSVLDFFKNARENSPTPSTNVNRSIDTIPEMTERAEQGSKIAQIFLLQYQC
jgi:TPR repeat protein